MHRPCSASFVGFEIVERHAAQHHVAPVARLVEEQRRLERVPRPEPVEVEVLAQARDVDAEVAKEAERLRAVLRVLDVHGAAPGEAHRPALVELVALGVAAEVVVVVEDQDPRLRAVQLAMEVRGREPADAAADDDEVVGLVEHLGVVEMPAFTRERVRDLEGTRMRTAQARERGRVVGRAAVERRPESRQRQRESEPREADVVDEVAACDAWVHVQHLIACQAGSA